MNLVRFMSTRELYRFLDGETISGNTEWRREGYASSSKGICFFPADPKPETRLHYLSGVVSFQIVGASNFEGMTYIGVIRKPYGERNDGGKDRRLEIHKKELWQLGTDRQY